MTSGEGCFSGKAPPQAKKTGELFIFSKHDSIGNGKRTDYAV